MSALPDCIFCKIVSGSIPAPRVFEDDRFICIRDIQPKAKVHLLVIPKKHVASLDAAFPEGSEGDLDLAARMLQACTQIARLQGLLPAGFRTIINTNRDGGQTVFHIHAHLLGGEKFHD